MFQSTPPARGATGPVRRDALRGEVSIHAPRAGGDMLLITDIVPKVVSIHAPRAGGDCSKGNALNPKVQLA